MSKLTRRKKYPPPYDEKVATRIGETSTDGEKTETMLKDKRIFKRAILSAKKHGINLKPGRENQGHDEQDDG